MQVCHGHRASVLLFIIFIILNSVCPKMLCWKSKFIASRGNLCRAHRLASRLCEVIISNITGKGLPSRIGFCGPSHKFTEGGSYPAPGGGGSYRPAVQSTYEYESHRVLQESPVVSRRLMLSPANCKISGINASAARRVSTVLYALHCVACCHVTSGDSDRLT